MNTKMLAVLLGFASVVMVCITFNLYDKRHIELEKFFAKQDYKAVYSEAKKQVYEKPQSNNEQRLVFMGDEE